MLDVLVGSAPTATDLTHAAALLVGLGLGIVLTVRLTRIVSTERRRRERDDR